MKMNKRDLDSGYSKSNEEQYDASQDLAIKKMLKITAICTGFLVAELVGGIISNSMAIISDAAHLLSDLSGFVISILALYVARKKPNKIYTFGYYRAEVIGALVSVITIWFLTGLLLKEAVERLLNPPPIQAGVMLITSIIGLICNLAMLKVLHSGGSCHHSHDHGPGSQQLDETFSDFEKEELGNNDDINLEVINKSEPKLKLLDEEERKT
jgi:cation diffusion facilitator family transporter